MDGFPRTVDQARSLDSLLQEKNLKLSMVIEMKIADDEVLVERIVARGVTSGRFEIHCFH